MLMKTCNLCGAFIPYGKLYCDKCEPSAKAAKEKEMQQANRISNRKYNKKRNPKYFKFYNSKQWKKLSKKRLIFDGFKCVKCGKVASEVHHIKPIQAEEGWSLRYDFGNLQSLCLRCHNKAHKRF